MAFIAIYDADALYPNTLRDLLIRIAQLPHLVQARWTEQILDEMIRARTRHPVTIDDVLAELVRSGLVGTAAALQAI